MFSAKAGIEVTCAICFAGSNSELRIGMIITKLNVLNSE